MQKTNFKKEGKNFLFLFIVIFIGVFSIVSTLEVIRNFEMEIKMISYSQVLQHNNIAHKANCLPSAKENSILINKIKIEAPIVFTEQGNLDFKEILDNGVAHYPQSAMPGEKGTSILLGHSAPVGWPKIKYDWVFSDLNNLIIGDEVKVFFENCEYTYSVSEKYFLDKGEELPESLTTTNDSILTLISCWPPGRDLRRIAIVCLLNK